MSGNSFQYLFIAIWLAITHQNQDWLIIVNTSSFILIFSFFQLFEHFGGLWVKLGQLLSLRTDMFSDAMCRELSRLQFEAVGFPAELAVAEIEKELRGRLTHHFRQFDPEPFAAASIAQVHRAVTTDGRTVAVKVLRPGVDETFARAIDTYRWAAAQLEAMGHGEARRLRPRLVIETFARWTARELDLRREGLQSTQEWLAEDRT